MSPLDMPHGGASLLRRAALACVLIVLATAAAASAAGLLLVDDITSTYERAREGRADIFVPEIDRGEAGEPRTLLLLGSDQRYDDKKLGIEPNSDTIVLVRIDPDREDISIMSIPRDLKAEIPGVGTAKINYAYKAGGPRKTVQTVKRLLTTPEHGPFEVNHVIEVGFSGFRRAIDYVGCVYVDIDRRYYNDNSGGQNYATIDIQPGYQKICGRDALDYVRYRHEDNDLVRAARQQDFLRQLKHQAGVKRFLNFDNRKELVRIFARYVDADKSLRDRQEIFSLLKLVIFAADKPVREVQFRIDENSLDDPSYLTASDDKIARTVRDFYEGKQRTGPRPGKREPSQKERLPRRKKRNLPAAIPGLEVAKEEGENQAVVAATRVGFPVYFPRLRLEGARYFGDAARTYTIKDEDGKRHRAYRMTLKRTDRIGEYYGVQGTTWNDPPILDNPSETRRVDGRKLDLYFDGRRLRLVAWRTDNAVYWVTNTLRQSISTKRLIGIASSLQRIGQ